jgi:fibronectin type 3 domain-containing protein
LAGWQEATGQDLNSEVLTPGQVFQNYSDGTYQLSALSLALGVGYQPVPIVAPTFQFEFGTKTSPFASGYTAVNEGTTYNATLGYGWQSGTVLSRVDSAPGVTTIQGAYDYTTNATFGVNLPNGTYNVTLTMGDSGFLHDLQGVFLQGIQVASVTTQAGQFNIAGFTATVTNGQLVLELKDLGGSDPNVVINSLTIVPTASTPPPVTTFDFKFGTPTSPVASGYTAINAGTTYSPALGYGWQSGTVQSRDDSAPGLTTVQDAYDYSTKATFAVNLANGTYNVTVTMGDSGFSHDLQGVFLQGTQVDSVTTNAGQFYSQTYSTVVTNGQLVLKLQDLGGNDPNVVINAMDLVRTS